jgi:hypothetical protein
VVNDAATGRLSSQELNQSKEAIDSLFEGSAVIEADWMPKT